MKKEKDVITQVVSKNRWGNPEIIKKDFLLIPLFIFFQILTPIIIVFGVLGGYGYPTTTAILFI